MVPVIHVRIVVGQQNAFVAKLVDAIDSKSIIKSRYAGSNPAKGTEHKYKIMANIDEMGVMHHAWDKKRLEELYNEVCNYFADLEMDEYKANEQAFIAIKISIHKRLNEQ